MKYEKWNKIHSLLSSEGLRFQEEDIFFNEVRINDFSEFRNAVVRARDAFIEECRENWFLEVNKAFALQTFSDLREKLRYVILEFFHFENQDGKEFVYYKPLGVELHLKGQDLSVLIPRFIFETIQILQTHLEGLTTKFSTIDSSTKEEPTRKYESAYLSYGYQLSPRLKNDERYISKLQQCYNDLKDAGFIQDGYLREFIMLFEGSISPRKIVWTGTLNNLKYYIGQLTENKIIENPKRRLYLIAESAFVNSKGGQINPGSLSARKDPDNTSSIDQVIADILCR